MGLRRFITKIVCKAPEPPAPPKAPPKPPIPEGIGIVKGD